MKQHPLLHALLLLLLLAAASCLKPNPIGPGPFPGPDPKLKPVPLNGNILRVAYIEVNDHDLNNAGCFQLDSTKSRFFDVAIVFAANINGRVDSPFLHFNNNVKAALSAQKGYVDQLHAKGIKVLLDVLGNHDPAGWTTFTDERVADMFAKELADCVQKYNLDGIDIDDEYSKGPSNDTSLIMVTKAMRKYMPGKIISKFLFADASDFSATWRGHRLSDFLDLGFCNYGVTNVQTYLNGGMTKDKISLSVELNFNSGATITNMANYIKNNNFGGMMFFNVSANSTNQLSTAAQTLDRQRVTTPAECLKSWVKQPDGPIYPGSWK